MKVLLLAGTGEARKLAHLLADAKIAATASFAGATRNPAPLAISQRVGGFGGEAAQEAYIRQQGYTAILDATHPFATKISARTARIASALGLPYLNICRPEWQPETGDKWISIQAAEQAVEHIPTGAKVFLATGRQTLPSFANLSGRQLFCRVIDPPQKEFPFRFGQFVVGKPPFSVEQEIDLFEHLGIDWLVVKNAGGAGGRAKLVAARQLGVQVLMIMRSKSQDLARVSTPKAAMAWLHDIEQGQT